MIPLQSHYELVYRLFTSNIIVLDWMLLEYKKSCLFRSAPCSVTLDILLSGADWCLEKGSLRASEDEGTPVLAGNCLVNWLLSPAILYIDHGTQYRGRPNYTAAIHYFDLHQCPAQLPTDSTGWSRWNMFSYIRIGWLICIPRLQNVRTEVLTTTNVKNSIFCDIAKPNHVKFHHLFIYFCLFKDALRQHKL